MTTLFTDPRVARMREMRLQGMSHGQIGDEYNITRERVRQLLAAAGAEPDKELVRAARRRRKAEARDTKKDEAIALYREGKSPEEIAGILKIGQESVREMIRAVVPPKERRGRQARRAQKKKYSNEDLVAILQETSGAVGGIVSVAAYNAYASGRVMEDGRPWPTHQAIAQRFGRWNEALRAAGLRCNESSAITGAFLFEPEHCIDALRSAARELGHTPTLREYDEIARASHGALPSVATVRNRCGGWTEALEAAGL